MATSNQSTNIITPPSEQSNNTTISEPQTNTTTNQNQTEPQSNPSEIQPSINQTETQPQTNTTTNTTTTTTTNQNQPENNINSTLLNESSESNLLNNDSNGNLNNQNYGNQGNINESVEMNGINILHRIPELEIGDKNKKTALIVVNVQNCFFRGGSFAMYPEKNINDDVSKEKDLIRKINQLIGLFEEDLDYFNAGLAGSPAMVDSLNEVTDFNTGLKHYEGSYPTGARKKYFFDHIVYTQTAYPPDHPSFASHHYLRDKKNKIKDLLAKQNLSYQQALKKITDDSVDKHFWSYVDPNFVNVGMNQFNEENKLYPDHALLDGSDVIIENQRCYRGVEFHPRLNLAPLYRPNINMNPDVYIKPPVIDGRGKIMWLGANNTEYPRSAFMNNNMESTGLSEYLKDKGVERVFVVGVFRDIMVEATLIDAIGSGFEDVNLIYDATLPYGSNKNETKVNNYLLFKNQIDIIKYLDKIESEEEADKFQEYLKENNPWVLNLESQNIKVINGVDILENIKIGQEEFGCGFYPDSLIKNFDVFLKTSTSTSRNQ
jgi:nicotinamidase-related amidase